MTDRRPTLDRRTLLATLGAGALGAAGTRLATADEGEDHYHNPVGPVGFGDVTAIQADDGHYYAYGTETPHDVVPIARSTDLVDWEYVGAALESAPDWRTEEDAGVWAPDINYYGGQYHLYYSYSTWGSNDNPGIGLATADDPAGPFADQGPVFREADLGQTNAIDPEFRVVDGTPYLVWGSWYGIYGVQLTDAADDYVPDTVFHLAGAHREGPTLVEANGYYYLFYSTGYCCRGYDSTYGVEVGRSRNFEGPYVNQRGTDLRDLNAHHSGVAVLSGTERFVGPGHNGTIRDADGDLWLLYHVEATAEREVRTMMLDRVQWEDDWPVVACTGHPSASSPAPGAGEFSCDDPRFESSEAPAITVTTPPTGTATSTATRTATETATATTADETRTATATTTEAADGAAGMGVVAAASALGATAAALLGRARNGGE